jgi:hypothetical protein
MSEAELKLKRKELGVRIFRTFTRELIMNSGPVYISKLQTIIEKDQGQERIHKKPKSPIEIKKIQEEKQVRLQEKIQEQKLRQQIMQREQKKQVLEQRRNIAFEKLRLKKKKNLETK